MKKIELTRTDKLIWAGSAAVITLFFLIYDRTDFLSYGNSLLGVTALIFTAKGAPIGQLMMIFFCLIYAYISYSCAYYGECITYLGMTAPAAVFSLISWLRHPYKGDSSEVQVNSVRLPEIVLMMIISVPVTILFYFILRHFNTSNLLPSTLSVTTSFAAVYLTFRRSPYYAIAYSLNDIVLMVLWTLATLKDHSYISVLMCFVVFYINDIYGFLSWQKMKERQRS